MLGRKRELTEPLVYLEEFLVELNAFMVASQRESGVSWILIGHFDSTCILGQLLIVSKYAFLGGGFKYFFNFHPENWGKIPI